MIRRVMVLGGVISSVATLGSVWMQAPVGADGSRDLSQGIRATAEKLGGAMGHAPGTAEMPSSPGLPAMGAHRDASRAVSAFEQDANARRQYYEMKGELEAGGSPTGGQATGGAGQSGGSSVGWTGPARGTSSSTWSGPAVPAAGKVAKAPAGAPSAPSEKGFFGRVSDFLGGWKGSAGSTPTGLLQSKEEIDRVLKEADRKERRSKSGESSVFITGQGADLVISAEDPYAPKPPPADREIPRR